MTAQSITTCSGYDLYLEALEWYALLDRELTAYDSIKPRTMVLATAKPSGQVSARNMTISSYDEHGFVFFSNATSRKGSDLQINANAALCAYWHPLKQQVSISGIVHVVDDEFADAHWNNRTRDSQLSAWASEQSQPLQDRQSLLNDFEQAKIKYRDRSVPRPPFWVGYCLVPDRIEFWRAEWRRPNVRTCYQKHEGGWRKTLLYP
jgi:pyridoxamine 5'-phosphate oxidase